MEKFRCTIDHITYQNQENGYSIHNMVVQKRNTRLKEKLST